MNDREQAADRSEPHRIVVYGLGAIGGSIAAALTAAGHDVVGIARGEQLAAVRRDGLTLRTPDGSRSTRFTCVADPAELAIGPRDIVLLCVKSQDTVSALQRLVEVGAHPGAVVCTQNGVENERSALRYFPKVIGAAVSIPASFLKAGEVRVYGSPRLGVIQLGRYPAGLDRTTAWLARCLEAGGFVAIEEPEIMRAKHAKLIWNVANIAKAAFAAKETFARIRDAAQEEARAALDAAGIPADGEDVDTLMTGRGVNRLKIDDEDKPGGSTWQSLARGLGTLETDYLNGEIVLIGRLNAIPTPVNQALCHVARHMVAGGLPPGSLTEADYHEIIARNADFASGDIRT